MPTSCAKCSMPMNFGEMAVFAFRAGPELCWHTQCFVCFQDGELLIDHVYCWDVEKQNLYCPRHWSESLKPRCAGCEEVCTFSNSEFFLTIAVHFFFKSKFLDSSTSLIQQSTIKTSIILILWAVWTLRYLTVHTAQLEC